MSKLRKRLAASLITAALLAQMLPMSVLAAEPTVSPTDLPATAQEEVSTADLTADSVPAPSSVREVIEKWTEPSYLGSSGEVTVIDSGTCGQNLTYSLTSDGLLTVSGEGEMDNYSDESLPPWQEYATSKVIHRIILSEGVKSIGKVAFGYCYSLTEITIPSSLESIAWDAFECSTSIDKINVPEGNPYFVCQDGVLYNKDLTRIVLFPGTKKTANNIPDTVSVMPSFENYKNLESITIPKSMEKIGREKFLCCKNLKEVVISEGVKEIMSYAFWSCDNLKRIVIPKSIQIVHEDAIDEGLNADPTLNVNIYYNGSASDWKKVTVGSRNRAIQWAMEEGRFRYNANDIVEDGVCGQKSAYTLYKNGLLKIDGRWSMYVFDDDNNLPPWFWVRDSVKSLEINSNIVSISSYAFEGMSNLTTVVNTFGWNVSKECFHNCGKLRSITLGSTISYIGADAFSCCYGLNSIVIPKSVRSIGSDAFTSSGLTDVYYTGTEDEWKKISIGTDTKLKYLQSNGKIHYNYENILVEGKCGDNVTATLLKDGRLILSGSGATYDYDAAGGGTPWRGYGRDKITSIGFSSSSNITRLGYGIFQGCYKAEEVTIPDTVTSIGGYAFSECSSIKKAVIPDSITVLDETVFNNCGSLTDVTLPKNLTSIGRHAFSCTAIASVQLPDTLTVIRQSAFNGTPLTNVVLPDSLTTIESHAFSYCNSLKTITVPRSVTSIGNDIFLGVTSLTDIYYGGSKYDWSQISINSSNEALFKAKLHTVEYDVQPNVRYAASKLYEPWGLKYYAVYEGNDADRIADRGMVMLKDTYYTDGMTPEAFCADAHAVVFRQSEQKLDFDDTLNAYYATLEDGIYSYDIAAKYYVVPFAELTNGETVYGSIKSNSMENILDHNQNDGSVSAEEKAICSCILALKESVAAHYAQESIPGASPALSIPRGTSQTAAASVRTAQESGVTPNIYAGASRMIEPWGLRYYADFGTGETISERGVVILHQADYQTAFADSPDAMRCCDHAFVFRDSDGTLIENGGSTYFATVTDGISSRNIGDLYYVVPFAVLTDGSYVYGQVKSNSMLHIMNINLNGEAISDTEKNVERDIISLYEAVKTYYNAKEGND